MEESYSVAFGGYSTSSNEVAEGSTFSVAVKIFPISLTSIIVYKRDYLILRISYYAL